MTRIRPKAPLTIAIVLGLSLAGGVVAQSTAPTAAQQQELDTARTELDRAAERYADLTRKYHAPAMEPLRIERPVARKPVIGVVLGRSGDAGVRVAGVTPGGGAEQAGLRTGDTITAIGGKPLDAEKGSRRYDDAVALLADIRVDKPVAIDYLRAGRADKVLVSPKMDQQVFVLLDGELSRFDGNVSVTLSESGAIDIDADHFEPNVDMESVPTAMPGINREVTRIFQCDDDGGDCHSLMLTEAFRWSGLNLADVDPQLGRYFGTEQGVLVLSTGGELAGLQPGDVVQKIDGRPVDSPREAMAALRARPAESRVRVDYLRDRKPASARVMVPKATPFRVPPPPPAPPVPPTPSADAPAPPAPPAPPPAPSNAVDVPTPPAAPAPPDAPKAVQMRKVVIVENGRTRSREGGARESMRNGVPKNAGDAKSVERRKIVKVDENGKTWTWEGDADDPLPEWADDMPPPPPPPQPQSPPPAPPAPDSD